MEILGVRVSLELKKAILEEARRLRVRPSDLVRMTLADRLNKPRESDRDA